MRVLDDRTVIAELSPEVAVAAVRSALIDSYSGALVSPPRLRAGLGKIELVFTAGGYLDGPLGFRAYGTWPSGADQAVLVWEPGGRLLGCVVGSELGARRTGALGGVAVDVLARTDASVAAMIGSGRQAWTQLWALTAVRRLTQVRVFSPNSGHRRAFALRAREHLGLDATEVDDPRKAVSEADIVVLATRSTQTVIEANWLAPGTHVTTIGPNTLSQHETPPELIDLAAVVASDSPAQAAAYGEPYFTPRELTHLGALLCGDASGRRADDEITVYCSTGLSGSEVLLANALLDPGK